MYGMEWNGKECFVIFLLFTKKFDLGLGIPKSKFLGSRGLQYGFRVKNPEKNEIE